MTTWRLPQTSKMTEHERALSSSFLSVHRHAHTHRGSSNESFTPSTCPCSCERFSSPCPPFLLRARPAALFPLPPALEVRRLQPAAHSAQRGVDLSDEFLLTTNSVRVNPHKLRKRKKYHGMIDDLDNVDFITSNVNSSRQDQERTKGWSIEWCGLCAHQHTFFSKLNSVVHFWRQRSRDQNDN